MPCSRSLLACAGKRKRNRNRNRNRKRNRNRNRIPFARARARTLHLPMMECYPLPTSTRPPAKQYTKSKMKSNVNELSILVWGLGHAAVSSAVVAIL